MSEKYTFKVDKSNLRIDQFLATMLPEYSRSKIQSFIKLGQVEIDGKPIKSSLILNGLEVISCNFE